MPLSGEDGVWLGRDELVGWGGPQAGLCAQVSLGGSSCQDAGLGVLVLCSASRVFKVSDSNFYNLKP